MVEMPICSRTAETSGWHDVKSIKFVKYLKYNRFPSWSLGTMEMAYKPELRSRFTKDDSLFLYLYAIDYHIAIVYL